MTRVAFEGHDVDCREGESILDALQRRGLPVESSCRSGTCHTCMLVATEGVPPSESQIGLNDTSKSVGRFLPCCAHPTEPLSMRRVGRRSLAVPSTIVEKVPLNADIFRLRLETAQPLTYRSGQFVYLVREDGLSRPYSLASVPGLQPELEFHVRRVPGGAMSTWLWEEASVGDTIDIDGPSGTCVYSPDQPDEALVLAGISTGLAPLYGILRDALDQGHTGSIDLYFGASLVSGLYAIDELRALAIEFPNVTLHLSAADAASAEGVDVRRLDEMVLQNAAGQREARFYLCGAPNFVDSLRRRLFLGGVSLSKILCDPFEPSMPWLAR